jgi:hypothetical protein
MKKTALFFVRLACLIVTSSLVNAKDNIEVPFENSGSFKDPKIANLVKNVSENKKAHVMYYYIKEGKCFFFVDNNVDIPSSPVTIDFSKKTKEEKVSLLQDALDQANQKYGFSPLINTDNAYNTLNSTTFWSAKLIHGPSGGGANKDTYFLSYRTNGEKFQDLLRVFAYGLIHREKQKESTLELKQGAKVYFVPVEQPSGISNGQWVSEQKIRELSPNHCSSLGNPFLVILKKTAEKLKKL